jgi:hypothetical protein
MSTDDARILTAGGVLTKSTLKEGREEDATQSSRRSGEKTKLRGEASRR